MICRDFLLAILRYSQSFEMLTIGNLRHLGDLCRSQGCAARSAWLMRLNRHHSRNNKI